MQGLGRRQFIKTVCPAAMGLNLGGLLRAQSARAALAKGPRPTGKIKSCILIFYYGGPSHLDTYDLKPDASSEIRGEFKPIATSAPGVHISEHLPRMARVMHKVALIRSMHHANRSHDSASIETLTGRPPIGGDRELFNATPEFFPSYGGTLSYLWRAKGYEISHAALPWVFHNVVDQPCQGGGFLGRAYDPFRITGDAVRLNYGSEMLKRPPDLTMERIEVRLGLLRRFDGQAARRIAQTPLMDSLDTYQKKAVRLLASDSVARALDIERESEQLRDRYGRGNEKPLSTGVGAENAYGRNLRGQNLLLARRLVEAGVPFVNVYDFKQQGQNWDSHTKNFEQHRDFLLPPADQALSVLIDDLDQRGLLDTTLVVGLGEFGRTPKINGVAGRDHWPDCYSVVLAGGGVKGGYVHGASDKFGAYPDRDGVTPADLAATIFWRFGLDPASEIHDELGRPYPIAEGKPIRDLFV
jgi:hypothetical protein